MSEGGGAPTAPLAGSEQPLEVHLGAASPKAVGQCLACHVDEDGALDIVGLAALQHLPEEWPILFEDAFDLDGDGIAGAMRYVSGGEGPVVGLYGSVLAAGRFEDFASIAGEAHGIDVSEPDTLRAVLEAFLARSPDPLPMRASALARFEARGCAACHVTRGFEHDGRTYRPFSDFLLHDLGDGPVRTAPLWGCPACLDAPAHGTPGVKSRP